MPTILVGCGVDKGLKMALAWDGHYKKIEGYVVRNLWGDKTKVRKIKGKAKGGFFLLVILTFRNKSEKN